MVLDVTGNAMAVAEQLLPHVGRVIVANAREVRLIAQAKIKTDKIDAAVLAQLHASGFLPEVWIRDATTKALRRQVARRNQIVRQRTRLKNIVRSILHAHLIAKPPVADLFGKKGRIGLGEQPLPIDERLAVERHLRELDRLAENLKVIEKDIVRHALEDSDVRRLMTVTDHSFTYQRREPAIEAEARLEGLYVIRTSLPSEAISAEQAVTSYKALAQFERAFRSLKSVDLQIRPVYHWRAPRVRAHLFLCMLAYHVE